MPVIRNSFENVQFLRNLKIREHKKIVSWNFIVISFVRKSMIFIDLQGKYFKMNLCATDLN